MTIDTNEDSSTVFYWLIDWYIDSFSRGLVSSEAHIRKLQRRYEKPGYELSLCTGLFDGSFLQGR